MGYVSIVVRKHFVRMVLRKVSKDICVNRAGGIRRKEMVAEIFGSGIVKPRGVLHID
jgi:hypothetical protein